MKILLVQPRIDPWAIVFGMMEPMALMVLSAMLKQSQVLKNKIQVEIIDLRVEKSGAFRKKLAEFQPDIVGVTGITIDYFQMIDVLVKSRLFSLKTVTIVGGHHATMMSQDFTTEPYALLTDCVVKGPSLVTFPEIVKRIIEGESLNGLPGVLCREGEEFVGREDWDIPDINLFPVPDRTLINPKKYKFDGFRWGLVITAQGCPFRCDFCACWKIAKGTYQTRKPEDVVRDIMESSYKRIFFGDDHTFGNVDRAFEIARLLQSRGVNKIFQGYCRADIVAKHPDLIELWKKVGLQALTIGEEALDDAELQAFNKKSSVAVNRESNLVLARAGVHNYAHIMIRPEFIKDDFRRIREHVCRSGIAHPVFPVLTPLPGTNLWESLKDQIHPNMHPFFDLAHPLLPTALLIEDFYSELISLVRWNYSVKRWIIARAKGFANIFQADTYPWLETRAPEAYMIPLARILLHDMSKKSKIEPFLNLLR